MADGTTPATIVTGASTGIGREIALVAAAEGRLVVPVARSADKLDALAREIAAAGGRCEPLALDLGQPEAGQAIDEALAARGLHVEVLVNNAGFGILGRAAALPRERQLALVDLNMRAVTDLTLRFLPGMVERARGGVLNVASVASAFPGPGMALYYASKAFVRSFSEALHEETRGAGVTVTCLCPGPVATPFLDLAGARRARLFKLLPKASARRVAAEGWAGFKAGRRLVVPTLAAKATLALGPLIPKALALPLVLRAQTSRA